MSVRTLPEEWFKKPFMVNTLIGLAQDMGHDPTPPYGDDGLFQMGCRRCRNRLDIGANARLQDRSLVDTICPFLAQFTRTNRE